MLATCVALAACGKGDGISAAMPKGYEAVNAAFGYKPADLISRGNSVDVPVIEFREGGAYAMYPFISDCNGRFSLGAGTIFTKDGTIKESSKPLLNSEIRARPQFSALADKVCQVAKTNKAVSDPFQPADALAVLYGPLDANGKAQMRAKLDGKETQFLVSVERDGEFTDKGVRRHFLLSTAANQTCSAHACTGGFVGMSVFRFEAGKWKLEKHQPTLFEAGHSGTVLYEKPLLSDVDVKTPLLQINLPCFGNGECISPVKFIGWTGSEFKVVLDTTLSEELGIGGCTAGDNCTLWQGEFLTDVNKDAILPDLHFHRTGQEGNSKGERPLRVEETIVYRYDPAKTAYVELSRKAEPRTDIPALPDPNENYSDENDETDDVAGPTETAHVPAPKSAPDPRQEWMADCKVNNKRFTTAAGSTVALNESEATQMCGCIYSASPRTEAAFDSARNSCFGRL